MFIFTGYVQTWIKLWTFAINIMSPLLKRQPFFEKYDFIGADVAGMLFEKGVCLPSDTKMTEGDLERVVNTIKKLWGV